MPMHENEIYDTVRQEASIDSTTDVQAVTEATPQTLGERIARRDQ